MEEQMYEVWTGKTRIASNIRIEDALLLIKAEYEQYYLEQMEITIKPMARCSVKENEGEGVRQWK